MKLLGIKAPYKNNNKKIAVYLNSLKYLNFKS